MFTQWKGGNQVISQTQVNLLLGYVKHTKTLNQHMIPIKQTQKPKPLILRYTQGKPKRTDALWVDPIRIELQNSVIKQLRLKGRKNRPAHELRKIFVKMKYQLNKLVLMQFFCLFLLTIKKDKRLKLHVPNNLFALLFLYMKLNYGLRKCTISGDQSFQCYNFFAFYFFSCSFFFSAVSV